MNNLQLIIYFVLFLFFVKIGERKIRETACKHEIFLYHFFYSHVGCVFFLSLSLTFAFFYANI